MTRCSSWTWWTSSSAGSAASVAPPPRQPAQPAQQQVDADRHGQPEEVLQHDHGLDAGERLEDPQEQCVPGGA
ncbi:hypothetical protein [Streptosporangium longisporum]|uniref:hypothetical protein n=1 Tax=Streptosporangium longisporum TaxID=46187 RepID=UPI0031F0BD65